MFILLNYIYFISFSVPQPQFKHRKTKLNMSDVIIYDLGPLAL